MQPGTGKKVLVAMSGGVDSSVTAALLQEQGYEVVGCFMRLGSEDSVEAADAIACQLPQKSEIRNQKSPRPHHQGCCSLNDASDARLVAAMLDIPFYVLNFKKDFGRIIDYFVAEYNAGRTPNPCVRCNDWLKFGKLYAYAQSIDADYVATGHYARIARDPAGRARLLRGLDAHKDQSYVLFGSPRDRLDHMLLPIGEFRKSEVRQLAEARNLPVFNKPDSQEICFVPDNDYARLVRQRSPDTVQPGEIRDSAGQLVGHHAGHQHFTHGQRRGLGIAHSHPLYVLNRDPATNTVTVGAKEDLLAHSCTADETNWLTDPPTDWRPCSVKVRYNSQPTPAQVRAIPGVPGIPGAGGDSLEVRFDEPIAAVTPGQAVVCYDGDTVLGGGWIRGTG